MAIRFSNQGIKYNLKDKRKVGNWIKEVAKNHNKQVGELSIVFVSDEEILSINQQYLNHNYFTDIITFDYSFDRVIEGDIFISIDTVKTNSQKFRTDYGEELFRVIIHGVLHLIGFKDKNPKDKNEMTFNENVALNLFKKYNE